MGATRTFNRIAPDTKGNLATFSSEEYRDIIKS